MKKISLRGGRYFAVIFFILTSFTLAVGAGGLPEESEGKTSQAAGSLQLALPSALPTQGAAALGLGETPAEEKEGDSLRLTLPAAPSVGGGEDSTFGGAPKEELWKSYAREMVQSLRGKGIGSEAVLKVMEALPRHLFCAPDTLLETAYNSQVALMIAEGQTLSRPESVATMVTAAGIQPGDMVLEIGTGSGYEAAVLAKLGVNLYTIEYFPKLSESAKERLRDLKIEGISYHVGNGCLGWPGDLLFDVILFSASPERIPKRLQDQVKPQGRIVAPMGRCAENRQYVRVFTRSKDQDSWCPKNSGTVHRFIDVQTG